jgi:3',5'-cyclic AMP phosphodiesterase CpdA
MKKIVHISDLHFGRVDERRIAPLIKHIQDIKPDIVVISGDFTQRAKESEFMQAKAFLDKVQFPVFPIPGNHDVPLYNVFRRYAAPFTRYKKYISTATRIIAIHIKWWHDHKPPCIPNGTFACASYRRQHHAL